MGCPGISVGKFVMNECFGTQRGNKMCAVVIWSSTDASISRHSGIWLIGKQMIQTDFSLGQKFVPQMEWEIWSSD